MPDWIIIALVVVAMLVVLTAIPVVLYIAFSGIGERISTMLEDRGVHESAWSLPVSFVVGLGGIGWFTNGGPLLAGVIGFSGLGLCLWLYD